MRLFIMRHARACETFPDRERRLSDEGRLEVKRLCAAVDTSLFERLAQIWHSPYARAAETAAIFAGEMKLDATLCKVSNATPEDNPKDIARTIANLAGFGGDLMLVSHNPFAEKLSGILTGAHTGHSAIFGTATLAGYTLEFCPDAANPYGVWSLDFLISPNLLR